MNTLFRSAHTFFLFKFLFISSVFSVCAQAFDGYIEVENETGYDIHYLYISHEDTDDWEEDVLEDDILENGNSLVVELYGYTSSTFDVRAEDEDGDTYTLYGIDVARHDLTLTLDDLDGAGEDVSGDFNGYVEVTNKTGYDVYYLYVSHENSDDWEEDVLEEDILEQGDSIRVDLTNYVSPMFDVRGEDENENTYTVYGVDVSTDDVILTRKHID